MAFKIESEGPHFDRLVRWLATNHPDQTILSYPNLNGDYNVHLTGVDLERVSAFAAAKYSEAFQQLPTGEVSGGIGFQSLETNVIAVVSLSTLASHLTFLALQRLGLSPMFISPRLAESGYAHLLQATGCHTVLAAGPSLEFMHSIKKAYDGPLDVLPMLEDDEFLAGLALPQVDLHELPASCNPGVILHTGGTTGLPKPVAFDLGTWLTSFPQNRPVPVPLLCTVPIFHLYGLGSFMVCLLGGMNLCLLSPHRPVTAKTIWRALDASGAMTLYTVPYTLKFFAETEGGVERLAALGVVRSGGSATPDELGDLLIRKGVRMSSGYGQTESGATMRPYGPGLGEWNWLTPTPPAEKFITFEKVGDNLYHLVVLSGFPTLKLSDRPDGSYGTQDLFRPHPKNLPGNDTRAGKARWKFVTRQGDIVVLANGENADPSPIEDALRVDPYIQMAIAFSAGPERLGLLVIPTEKAEGLSSDEIVQAILPSLIRGNSLVSDYAKISPDDIIVKPVGTPYPQTAKMTLQRYALTELFANDIEALRTTRDIANARTTISDDQISDIVKRVVEDQLHDTVLGSRGANGQSKLNEQGGIDDETDFFHRGMDSLQSSLIRRQLQREIPLPDGATLATNVVFEYPTLKLLSEHIKSLRQGTVDTNISLQAASDRGAIATAMVQKYSSWGANADRRGGLVTSATCLGKDNSQLEGVSGQVIVLTGATGYLGVQILNTLLNRSDVSLVYCLVRIRPPQDHSHDNAARRVYDALKNSELVDNLSPTAKAKLRCLSSNLAAANLGLLPADYSEIQSRATAIIHNAWSVNFNMALESFEPNVASVYHLLNLGRLVSDTTPGTGKKAPTFVFISSVAAVGAAVLRGTPAEERMYDWQEAMPIKGYGQSKWVAEQICASASKRSPEGGYRGPVRILRVAQVSGDTRRGIWNPTEAIPAMVQSALTVGALPRMDDQQRNQLCWLPCDTAGAAVVDLTMIDDTGAGSNDLTSSCEENLAVFHVANPHALRWNEDVLPAAAEAGLGPFRVVSQYEWVRILSESDKDVERNPPYKLIQHFQQAYGAREEKDRDAGSSSPEGESLQNCKGEEKTGVSSRLNLMESLKYSSSLKDSPAVDGPLLVKYIQFWLRYWPGGFGKQRRLRVTSYVDVMR